MDMSQRTAILQAKEAAHPSEAKPFLRLHKMTRSMSEVSTTSSTTLKTDQQPQRRHRPLKTQIEDLLGGFLRPNSPNAGLRPDCAPVLPEYSNHVSPFKRAKLNFSPTKMLTSCISSKADGKAGRLWEMVSNMRDGAPWKRTVDKLAIFKALETLQNSEGMNPIDLNQKARALISRPGLLHDSSLVKIIEGEEYDFETKKAAARSIGLVSAIGGSLLATEDPRTELPLLCFLPKLLDLSTPLSSTADGNVRYLTTYDGRFGSQWSEVDVKRFADDRECFLNAVVKLSLNFEALMRLDDDMQQSIVTSAIIGVNDMIKKDGRERWQPVLDALRDHCAGVFYDHEGRFEKVLAVELDERGEVPWGVRI